MRPASRDHVLALVREFYDRHGRLPFKHEWEHADGERPARRTIERRWGWEELLADAVDIEPDEVEDAYKSEDRYVAIKRRSGWLGRDSVDGPARTNGNEAVDDPRGERTSAASAAGT
jgi:hypothetical protein